MHHTAARRVVSLLLNGSGVGRRGMALVAAVGAGDFGPVAQRVGEAAINHIADSAGTHTVHRASPGSVGQALPVNEHQLCEQVCNEIIAQPADVGLKLAYLSAVIRLWSHVGADERARVRLCLLESLAGVQAPPDSQASVTTLRLWQGQLPTMVASGVQFMPSDLRDLVEHADPGETYRNFAGRCQQGADLGILFRVLGTLAVRLRLGRNDPQGYLRHAILGAIAGEALVRHAPPVAMATLLVQLAHQVWWCRHHAGLELLPATATDPGLRFVRAVEGGDQLMAVRAARYASKQPEQFWQDAWSILENRIAANTSGWIDAFIVQEAIAWRTGHNVVSPDDAGLVGMVLTEAR